MAWSIFRLGVGDSAAVAWAVELLAALGLQATPDRLHFVFDWERSEGGGGAYNPLNQGPVPGQPDLSGGTQFGGGASDYHGWQAGLLGAVAYLQMPNFAGVLSALRSDNYAAAAQALWASPWAAGHYGNGSSWYTGQYPGMSPAQIAGVAKQLGMDGAGTAASQGAGLPGAGATGTVPGTAPLGFTGGGASNANPQVPGMNDIPALDAYIKANFPTEAWLLSIPEVKTTLEQAVANGWTGLQVQATIQGTDWWKHTSQAQIAFDQIKFQTPEELNFDDPGSKAAQTLAHVMQIGSQNGTMWASPTMRGVALQALQYGWSDAQIQARLGSMVTVTPKGAGVGSNDPQLLAALTGAAGDYLVNPSDSQLQPYARQIASGTMTLDGWKAYLAGQAKAKFPTMAAQIDQGLTPNQIIDPLRQDAARIMETPSANINFINDPMYSKILQYRPPDAGGKVQPVRTMDSSEMETYLRGTDQWAHTQQARDQDAGLAKQILTTFGTVKT